jgi:hypothetical protein
MDGWSPEYGLRAFEGILTCWLELNDGGIKLRTHALDLAPRMHFKLGAEQLADMVRNAFGRYKTPWAALKQRVMCLVCDNASDVVATAQALGVDCFRCLVHSANLAVKSIGVTVSPL